MIRSAEYTPQEQDPSFFLGSHGLPDSTHLPLNLEGVLFNAGRRPARSTEHGGGADCSKGKDRGGSKLTETVRSIMALPHSNLLKKSPDGFAHDLIYIMSRYRHAGEEGDRLLPVAVGTPIEAWVRVRGKDPESRFRAKKELATSIAGSFPLFFGSADILWTSEGRKLRKKDQLRDGDISRLLSFFDTDVLVEGLNLFAWKDIPLPQTSRFFQAIAMQTRRLQVEQGSKQVEFGKRGVNGSLKTILESLTGNDRVSDALRKNGVLESMAYVYFALKDDRYYKNTSGTLVWAALESDDSWLQKEASAFYRNAFENGDNKLILDFFGRSKDLSFDGTELNLRRWRQTKNILSVNSDMDTRKMAYNLLLDKLDKLEGMKGNAEIIQSVVAVMYSYLRHPEKGDHTRKTLNLDKDTAASSILRLLRLSNWGSDNIAVLDPEGWIRANTAITNTLAEIARQSPWGQRLFPDTGFAIFPDAKTREKAIILANKFASADVPDSSGFGYPLTEYPLTEHEALQNFFHVFTR